MENNLSITIPRELPVPVWFIRNHVQNRLPSSTVSVERGNAFDVHAGEGTLDNAAVSLTYRACERLLEGRRDVDICASRSDVEITGAINRYKHDLRVCQRLILGWN